MNNRNECICAVIKDLLPLYHDKVVRKETEALIENHLSHCEECNEEYQLICFDLPVDVQTSSTKNCFVKMMNKKRGRQMLVTITCAILSCALLIGAYFGQLQLPIFNVSDDDISIERVYRYKTEEGYKFFVLYHSYHYGYSVGKINAENDGTLVYTKKKPLITARSKTKHLEHMILACGYETGDHGEKIFADYSSVKFGKKTIWTADQQSNQAIPGYVYAYDSFEKLNNNETGWTCDEDKNQISVFYGNGTMITWDFDGNVIVDTHTQYDGSDNE